MNVISAPSSETVSSHVVPRPALGRAIAFGVLLALSLASASPASARIALRWSKRAGPTCEPPHVFYSSRHSTGMKPCCPTSETVCPGGVACPASGICTTENVACTPTTSATRPNVILFLSDDQGSCHYGTAGECRSTQSGTPVPAPKTPNLDLLAGYGAVFPVAHNTASWCFPSLDSILTGRYQKSFNGQRRIADAFTTVARELRRLGGATGAPTDPYDSTGVIGGYCTLLGGKFAASPGDPTFDAIARTSGRALGRNDCIAGPPGQPPRCGTSMNPGYAPFDGNRISDVFNFMDMLIHRQPGVDPAQYTMQPFFIWYAPRIPHQGLRSPTVISDYLFGPLGTFPLGGVMDLGQWCSGSSCAPVVQAFDESNFGTVHKFFSSVWWVDDNIRELRHFLAAETAPHCIGADGRSRFDMPTPATCNGTWAGVAPDLARNTVFMYLSDNGWHLPNSKHAYTENGYRTRLFVFDPRVLPEVPPWDPTGVVPPPATEIPALAHGIDALPTVLGYALGTDGTQPCPTSADGSPCDGHDLRPYLPWAPGGAASPDTLRHALCGHHTERPTAPTESRYLLTRPGSVGRCTSLAATACTTSSQCGAGRFCLGGHCATAAPESSCTTNANCPAGAVCLAGRCRMGPVCLDDSDCTALLGSGYGCAAKQTNWCRNDPNVACATNADCPVCPSVNGSPVPCSRLCEPRMLKVYVTPGHNVANVASAELSDLFLDPDEHGLHAGDGSTIVGQLSKLNGPYGPAMRRLNCCLDDWWPAVVPDAGTLCSAGYSCPADFVCNE